VVSIQKQNLQIPFVDLGAQYRAIEAEVNDAVVAVMKRHDFILGHDVRELEKEFSAFSGVQYAAGVDSGLSAIELALRAYDIGPGDEVITVANTFIATVLAITATGAKPVLVDMDPATYNIDPNQIEDAITERTRAIVPVHLYGQPVDIDPMLEVANRHNLVVVEDAAQAHGARYKGKRAGGLGNVAAFSFYPGKNLGAYGDGGIVVTNDEAVHDKIQVLRNYGQRVKYHHIMQGFNRRLDTMQAAVLRVKLQHLDKWNAARRRHADLYKQLLAEIDTIGLPDVPAYAEPVWHLFVIQVDRREDLQQFLSDRGISTGIHYPIPIHLQPAYKDLGYKQGDFPITERAADRIVSLPMYPELTPELITYVVEAISEFYTTG
jgi:dTDP-4-amino-4,6-dideoxygalactose transaminase